MSTHPWRRFQFFPLLIATLVSAGGCGGEDGEEGNLSTDQVAVINSGITVWRAIDASLLANTAAMDFGTSSPGSTLLSPAHEYDLTCPDLTVNLMLTDLQVFMDYGADGCASQLTGQIHTGGVELSVSRLGMNGILTAHAVTTGDYSVNGIIRASYLDSTVTIEARDAVVTSPDGSVSLTSCLPITWSGGASRLLLSDDSWRIGGTAVVSTLDFKSGAIYDVAVVQGDDLIVIGNCRWPVAGTLTIERREPPLTARLEFGDGECDAMATVTVAGRSRTVDLDER